MHENTRRPSQRFVMSVASSQTHAQKPRGVGLLRASRSQDAECGGRDEERLAGALRDRTFAATASPIPRRAPARSVPCERLTTVRAESFPEILALDEQRGFREPARYGDRGEGGMQGARQTL